jgi:hypothetical protein
MNRHTSSTDPLAGVIIPILVSALAISTGAFSYKATQTAPSVYAGYLVFVAPLLLLTLLVAFYILKPLYITADAVALTIHRMVGPVSFPYTTILSISTLSGKDMSGSVRTFGNGGLFGYTGKYYNSRLGKMTWYCTQRKNYVLLILSDNKKIVITPDNPTELLRELRKYAPADMVINN